MTMTKAQKAARLEMIKAAAKRLEARKAFKAKQAANAATIRRYTDVVEKPKRKAREDEFDRMLDKLDENHNHWTDERAYAKQYYGDVAYQTTRYDNDWN